jgi:hypothetical protein
MTNFDKAINAVDFCGSACGFMIAQPKLVNPLNTILTALSAVSRIKNKERERERERESVCVCVEEW